MTEKFDTFIKTFIKKFQISKNNVKENYIEAIWNITACMKEGSSNLYESPLFKHIICMLDVYTWPTASSAEKFGDQEITEMTNYFANLFSTGPTQVDKISQEWLVLKSYMLPIISNNKKKYYLDTWKIVFSNEAIVKECWNILDIFKLFLICPFTNAKLEHMFSHMNRIKNDWCWSLYRDWLDVLLRIREDGPSLEEFNPDVSIDCWYTDKVCRLNAGPHNYPSKHKKSSDGKEVIDLAALTLSDLENDESDEDVNFDWETFGFYFINTIWNIFSFCFKILAFQIGSSFLLSLRQNFVSRIIKESKVKKHFGWGIK